MAIRDESGSYNVMTTDERMFDLVSHDSQDAEVRHKSPTSANLAAADGRSLLALTATDVWTALIQSEQAA